MNALVRDVMTARVIWVRKDASFRELAAALREYRVSAFPVLDDDGTVIGVVSEANMFLKQALADGQDGLTGVAGLLRRHDQEKARGITAGDLMTVIPVTVSPGDTVKHAARLMYTRRVKRLPVVGADRHLAGIISRADVLSVFDRSDADIRDDIRTGVLRQEFSVSPDTFTVTVQDGVVTLAGQPETSEVGKQIVHRVRHVQGVVAVRDRLSYPSTRHGIAAAAAFPVGWRRGRREKE